MKESDFVSVHCPLTAETENLINNEKFSLMKDGVLLVNTSRGQVVDEKALVSALREGKIWGAGLDVFENGDYPSDELATLDNAVLNPHLGTQTIETRNEMAFVVSQNIINFFEGGEVFKVNHI